MLMPSASFWRKKFQRVGYVLYLVLAVVGLIELAYRYQWVDFYATEWRALNGPKTASGGKSILFAGDSFTADPQSYAQLWPDTGTLFQRFNAAVPGTGPRQAHCFLPGRIREVRPDIFVYQLYVGNDLLDGRHPWNGRALSAGRRAYWWLSDRAIWLAWLNYKAGAWGRPPIFSETKPLEGFSPESYNAREKMLLAAEPGLLFESARLEGRRGRDMDDLIRHLEGIFSCLPKNTRVVLLVLPHAAQVTPEYRRRMVALGGTFPDEATWFAQGHPFAERLGAHFGPRGVHILDALPVLQAAEARGIKCYFDNDPHLTPDGQAIVGDFLRKNG